jgi:hypothetical protein
MQTTQEIVQKYHDSVKDNLITQPYLIVGKDYVSYLPEIDKILKNVPIVINHDWGRMTAVCSSKTDNVFNELNQTRFVPYNQLGRNLSFTIPKIVQFYYYQLLNPLANTSHGNLYIPNTSIDFNELSKQLKNVPILRSTINVVTIPTFVFYKLCGWSQDCWLLYEQAPAITWDLNDCAKQCLSVRYNLSK